VGRLLAFLAGLAGALLLLFRRKKKHLGFGVHPVDIVLKGTKGRCEAMVKPIEVTLSKKNGDVVRWDITNPHESSGEACPGQVEVCVDKWRFSPDPRAPHPWPACHAPVKPQGTGQFCRHVSPGHTKHLPARVKQDAREGYYKYSVFVGGHEEVDPIVRLVI
jgi:hypothetical protein